MVKFFSAPILIGIILGVLFPYQSMSLIWLSSFLLFALLFVNTLAVNSVTALKAGRGRWREVLGAQFLIFVFFPVLFTALAGAWLSDRDLVFGLAVSALAPCALANPFFVRQTGGEPELALVNVLVSTLICPVLMAPILRLLHFSYVYVEPRWLVMYLALLTVGPILISGFSGRFVIRLFPKWNSWLAAQNSLILAALMFILVGSSLTRLPSRLLLAGDMGRLFLIYVGMDFGVFILVRRLSKSFLGPRASETMAISVATRNFAVSASLMLLFFPKAALPSAVGLVVHCLFFQWLMIKKNDIVK